jgi:hypothetical protein
MGVEPFRLVPLGELLIAIQLMPVVLYRMLLPPAKNVPFEPS